MNAQKHVSSSSVSQLFFLFVFIFLHDGTHALNMQSSSVLASQEYNNATAAAEDTMSQANLQQLVESKEQEACSSSILIASEHKTKLVVVIPSFNNKDWYAKNLDSVFSQTYPTDSYRVIYTDDCSPDGTGALVEQYLRDNNLSDRATLIKNQTRAGALANIYNAVYSCDDNDVIVTLDGDDWFAGSHVFNRVHEAYAKGAWMTYGNFETFPAGQCGGIEAYPAEVVAQNRYRAHPWFATHLRTFKAGLFKRIRTQDLLWRGQFFPMTWDMAFMFPMLEMSREHAVMIPDVLYVYNRANAINDDKINRNLQFLLDRYVRSMPPYERLSEAPF